MEWVFNLIKSDLFLAFKGNNPYNKKINKGNENYQK